MKKEEAENSVVGNVAVKKSAHGSEYIQLNAFCAAYYRSRDNFSNCGLITPTPNSLPLIGYLVPNIYNAEHFGINVEYDDSNYIRSNGFVPAMQIKVKGSTANDDYTAGASVEYSVGLLYYLAVSRWTSCIALRQPWTVRIWEEAGFDFRKFVRRYWFEHSLPAAAKRSLAYSLETMEFAHPIDFDACARAYLQTICDLLQIDARGAVSLDRALRERVNRLTSEQMQDALSNGKTAVFSETKDVTEQLPRRLKRLIAVAMLFKYWDTNPGKYTTRAANLVQLGLTDMPNESTLWNDCVEAGCVPPSKSMLIKAFRGIRSQAKFYFDKHPHKIIALADELELEREFQRPRVPRRHSNDPLMRWGLTINLPCGVQKK